MRTINVFLAGLLSASPGDAGCVDIGTRAFLDNLVIVQLCQGEVCEPAVRSRSCGNIEYEAEDFSAESAVWAFLLRKHVKDDVADKEFLIRRDPVDPNQIPQVTLDGRPIYLQDAQTPLLDPDMGGGVTCIPQSEPKACDFVNLVLGAGSAP